MIFVKVSRVVKMGRVSISRTGHTSVRLVLPATKSQIISKNVSVSITSLLPNAAVCGKKALAALCRFLHVFVICRYPFYNVQ